jgi:protein arginine kinase activator
MQCQICKSKNATIHLTEITDGVRTEMHICENCAAEQDIAVKSHIPINELLSGLLAVQPSDEEIAGTVAEQKNACPNCGFTIAQFRKQGVLGCPYDYDLFEKSLLPLIEKAHDGKTTHCGKLPSKTPKNTRDELELLNLRRQLEEAVKSEDYELAAELRDKIKQMEDKDNP